MDTLTIYAFVKQQEKSYADSPFYLSNETMLNVIIYYLIQTIGNNWNQIV